MKKITLLIICAALSIGLTGCDNSIKSSEKNTEVISNAESSVVSKSEEQTSKNEQSHAESGGRKITENSDLTVVFNDDPFFAKQQYAATNDGVYLKNENVSEEFDHISYIDFASAQEIVLCADSACKHDNEKCTAVLSYDEFYPYPDAPYMFVYGNYLYILNVDFDNTDTVKFETNTTPNEDEKPVEAHKKSLYRMNLDGTGREKLFDFPADDAVEGKVVGDGDNLWFITKKPYVFKNDKGQSWSSSKNRALIKYSLKDRDFTERIPLDEVNNVTLKLEGVYKNKFVFSGTAYPNGKRAEDYLDILSPKATMEEEKAHMDEFIAFRNKCENVMYTLNRDNKSVNEIFRAKYSEVGNGVSVDGGLAYLSKTDDTKFALDLETGETRDISAPEGYSFGGFMDGKKIYNKKYDGKPEFAPYFDDGNGGVVKYDWWAENNMVIFANDKYAFVNTGRTSDEQPNGNLLNAHDTYALIPLEDLQNGKENIIEVKRLEDH